MDARVKADVISMLARGWFDFPEKERDGRNAFTGIMTRDPYTKAAHPTCLGRMLPPGRLTLVSEQERALARVVPHVFRDRVEKDAFEWHVASFDKDATKPQMLRRTSLFHASFKAYRREHPGLEPREALHRWAAERLTPAVKRDRSGQAKPFPMSNFTSRTMPALWLRSPLQVAGETDKAVGFPILPTRHRAAYRAHGIEDEIVDDALRAAMTRRVIQATIQPASTFMNALRERVSFALRSGGRSARSGPAYVNGACFNPRVLIAVLNIHRVHYDFFERRQYVSPINRHAETSAVIDGTTSLAVPGSDRRIEVPKRRRRAPVRRTPAMRAGIHRVADGDDDPAPPDPSRMLYQPWLLHGTPLWAKLRVR